MEDIIKLHARYGYKHQLTKIGGNFWRLDIDPKSSGTYRLIGFEGKPIQAHVSAIDPDGGPFISVGDVIDNKKVKSIAVNGILELEDLQ